VPKEFKNRSMLFENTESIVKVERKTKIFDRKSKKYRERLDKEGKRGRIPYYAATFVERADKMAEIIREHWGIENKNNYVRDVTLNEDNSRIRKNPGIFARFRSFALNILRFNHIKTGVTQHKINPCYH
jgi:predicted transposase YbfD/YdcC